jgi:P4 family phage/plasmid primase-like protien
MTVLTRCDLTEIRRAVELLFSDVKFGAGECVEVRMMHKQKHLTVSGWFDDPEAMVKAVARLARDGFGKPNTYQFVHQNIYWTANPVTDALLARQEKNKPHVVCENTSDANITRRIWLPADIDPVRASGVSATKSEKKLAIGVVNALLEKLTQLGFPEESLIGGDSGNGYHLLIRIDLPNDAESRELIKRCIFGMQALVGIPARVEVDPTVFNAARIMKAYGTLACKGVNTPDRPWRMSLLKVIPDGPIVPASRELLEKLSAFAPDRSTKRDLGGEVQKRGPWNAENAQKYLGCTTWDGLPKKDNSPEVVEKWVGTCINDESHRDSAFFLYKDGWVAYTCFHASCQGTDHNKFFKWAEEQTGEAYPRPGIRSSFENSVQYEVEDVVDEIDISLPGETRTEVVSVSGTVRSEAIEPKKFQLTDAGNGERMAHWWGHKFRYCTQRGWYYWTGKRWQLDVRERVEKYALKTVRDIPEKELDLHLDGLSTEASKAESPASAMKSKVLKWSRDSESQRGLSAMVSLCHSIGRNINMGIECLDQQPWLFNCVSGTIDLRTGEHREHRQEDLITNLSPVEYDPKADCPTWLEFLDTVLAGDQELIAFLQRATGYSLTGSTAAHCLFMLYGNGRNGKTTFLEVLAHIMGTYGQSASMEMFLAKNVEGIPNDLAALHSARFVTGVETEDGRRLAEAKVKQITGGDTITARFLHKEFFQFQPQFKIWMGTNHRPVIRGTDEGIWRRIRLVPFTVYIPDGKVDETLREKLIAEAPGILNWMLKGLEDYRLGGLLEPEAVLNATEDYRKAEDWLQRFLDTETTPSANPSARVQARKLYQRYRRWAEEAKEHVQSERKFNEALESHGIEFSKEHNKKLYHLTLRNPLTDYDRGMAFGDGEPL